MNFLVFFVDCWVLGLKCWFLLHGGEKGTTESTEDTESKVWFFGLVPHEVR